MNQTPEQLSGYALTESSRCHNNFMNLRCVIILITFMATCLTASAQTSLNANDSLKKPMEGRAETKALQRLVRPSSYAHHTQAKSAELTNTKNNLFNLDSSSNQFFPTTTTSQQEKLSKPASFPPLFPAASSPSSTPAATPSTSFIEKSLAPKASSVETIVLLDRSSSMGRSVDYIEETQSHWEWVVSELKPFYAKKPGQITTIIFNSGTERLPQSDQITMELLTQSKPSGGTEISFALHETVVKRTHADTTFLFLLTDYDKYSCQKVMTELARTLNPADCKDLNLVFLSIGNVSSLKLPRFYKHIEAPQEKDLKAQFFTFYEIKREGLANLMERIVNKDSAPQAIVPSASTSH